MIPFLALFLIAAPCTDLIRKIEEAKTYVEAALIYEQESEADVPIEDLSRAFDALSKRFDFPAFLAPHQMAKILRDLKEAK